MLKKHPRLFCGLVCACFEANLSPYNKVKSHREHCNYLMQSLFFEIIFIRVSNTLSSLYRMKITEATTYFELLKYYAMITDPISHDVVRCDQRIV